MISAAAAGKEHEGRDRGQGADDGERRATLGRGRVSFKPGLRRRRLGGGRADGGRGVLPGA